MTTLAEYAVSLGLPVFPCGADKAPMTARGFYDASRDPAVIRQMFNKPAVKMIGVRTGAASGLMGVDVDVKNGAQGQVWLDASEVKLPQTRRHSTTTNGRHLIYLVPPDVEIRNSTSMIAPGIDIRSEGGYLIWEGSPGYSVVDPAPFADMPQWLIDACQKPAAPAQPSIPWQAPRQSHNTDGTRYGLSALDAECSAILNAADGTKHAAINKAAYSIGGLVAAGELAEGAAMSALGSALSGILGRCADPKAAEKTLCAAFREGMAAPRQAPAPRPHVIRIEVIAPEAPPRDAAPQHWMGQDEQEEAINMGENVVRLPRAKAKAKEREPIAVDGLQLDGKDNVLPTMANALVILAEDAALGGLLSFDEFGERYLLMKAPPVAGKGYAPQGGPYPRGWRPEDISLVLAYMQRTWSSKFNLQTVEHAMPVEASRNRVHPVREWLAKLTWDKVPRIDAWLVTAFGCPADAYHSQAAAKMLIASVKRVRQPGVKFDHTPVLEGPQGIGKSSALRELYGSEWFSDAMPDDLAGKDAAMALTGVWCLEMAELQQVIKSDHLTVKGFLSRQIDHYRPPYGKTYIDRPRQTIIVGTTNDDEWLTDSTGNRRYWPLACTKADVPWIAANRDQLWAEAAAREAAGETHWIDTGAAGDQAKIAQASRMIEDAWGEKVEDLLEHRDQITVGFILDALNIPNAQQSKPLQMRVAAILRGQGWRKNRTGKGRFWVPETASKVA